MVIDEMIQCKVYKKIQCKRKTLSAHVESFCNFFFAEKTKKLNETTAQVTIRLGGLQWRVGRRSPTRHLSQACQDHYIAKHHFQKAHSSRLGKDAYYRKFSRVFHLSEVQQEVQVQQVGNREEVVIVKHELSQSRAEGSHSQNLFTTNWRARKIFSNSTVATNVFT